MFVKDAVLKGVNMFLKIIIFLALTFLGGVLYRLGGAAKPGKWYDFLCNTKARDFGIPAISLMVFFLFAHPVNATYWALILTFGAIFGVQTTYWKKKGTDGGWLSWLFTGLGYSACWLPMVIVQAIWPHSGLQTHWLGFGIRSVVCTALTVGVSQFFGNVVYEENARGEVEILTLPLLFIG